MKRRTFVQMSLGALPALSGASEPLHWDSRVFNAMGTTMSVKAAHRHPEVVGKALDAAVDVVRSLEDQMSLFRSDSAVSRLNRTGVLAHADADLLEILQIAQRVSRQSRGAFDVTVQPLWHAFDEAKAQGRLPTAREVGAARQRVGWEGLRLSGSSVRLTSGHAITLNGIAQGYAADKVKARLAAMGIAHALINAGEWASLGHPDRAGDWTLGVADPRHANRLLAGVALQGRCIATSADDQCSFSPDFVHHHIFDPHTGSSPTELSSVTVAARTCVMADALTKVFFMAGYARALPLAREWGVDVLVVDKQGRWQASPNVALLRV